MWEVYLDDHFWSETDAVSYSSKGVEWIDKDGSLISYSPDKIKLVGDNVIVTCKVEWFTAEGARRSAIGPTRKQ